MQATCKGVYPRSPALFRFMPASIRIFAADLSPDRTIQCNALSPSIAHTFTSEKSACSENSGELRSRARIDLTLSSMARF